MKGTGIAIITPFSSDLSVDFTSLEKLVEYTISGGVDFIVALGTTAETTTLTKAEQIQVVDTIKRVNQGRVPLVQGLGGNNTQAVLNELKEQNWDGIDGILSVSPYYNKPSQKGIREHFMAIDAASPKPIILYNVPSRTGSNVLAETCIEIAKSSKNIVAVKEASGDLGQCMEVLMDKPSEFTVLSGEDNLTIPMMHMGAEGVISVSAQAYPQLFKQVMQAFKNGNPAKANEIHYALYQQTNNLFAEGNPAGIKALLKIKGVIESDAVRLPLVAASDELTAKLRAEDDKIMA